MGRKRVTSNVDEELLAQAQRDFAELPNSPVSMKLMVIIKAGRNKKLEEIAEFYPFCRKSIYNFINAYKKHGVKGLFKKPGGHRKRRLTPEQETEIKRWLRNSETFDGNPINWTIFQLRNAIKERFNVTLEKTRVWELMREWHFKLKAPRPSHANSDHIQKEEFKKNSAI